MKKILFSLFILFLSELSAQTKLGLKLAPVIISNRATNDAQTADGNGSVAKLSIGLVVDKPLTDTYFLSSGLFYIPKRVAFVETVNALAEDYKLQYLQLPLTLKLFTNEIAPDFKVYFQVGGALEFKIFDEPEEAAFTTVQKFNPLDFVVLLGTGVEYRAGINTTLFGDVSYQRGLSNVVNTTENAISEDLEIRSTIISFDFGVKF